MQTRLQTIRTFLEQHFLARWMLANSLGWSLGLYLGSLSVRMVGGFLGLLVGGALAGAVAGAAQWLILRYDVDWLDRRWIGLSAAGGVLGALPVFLAGVVFLTVGLVLGGGLFNALGMLIGGALFGGIIGGLQGVLLNRYVDEAGWWVLANVVGGGLCGLLSLGVNPLELPICCTFGPLTFGAITGYVWLRLLQEEDI